MIEHIVLFKWKPDASPQAVQAALDGLRGLKQKLPEILYLHIGENFSDRSNGYSHALVVRFADRAGLESYGPSEAHQQVVKELILPTGEDVIVVDYEV